MLGLDLPGQWIRKKKFRELYFANVAVDLTKFGEFRREAFPESGPVCWLDRPNALFEVDRRLLAGLINEQEARLCAQWIFDGYVIVPGLIDNDLLDRVWHDYETAIAAGVVTPPVECHGPTDVLPGRHLDTHLQVPSVLELQRHPKVLAITDLLFGRKTLPFQTIMGHKGSSQSAHSDSIHMTTYPVGYLIADWIAFEDIHPDSGPLEFYPRSHRLVPTLLSDELGISPLEYKTGGGAVYHDKYECQIQRYIVAMKLKPELFMAKKGDVLFWHANLLHGGARRNDLTLSRKALVCHYFAQGAVTYHDLSGNPTRLHRNDLYAPARPD